MTGISLRPPVASISGCGGGGINECPLDADGVFPRLPPLGTTLELKDRLIAVFTSVSESCSLASTVVISCCSEEERAGEADFLLCASPLPPREELRGETLPV